MIYHPKVTDWWVRNHIWSFQFSGGIQDKSFYLHHERRAHRIFEFGTLLNRYANTITFIFYIQVIGGAYGNPYGMTTGYAASAFDTAAAAAYQTTTHIPINSAPTSQDQGRNDDVISTVGFRGHGLSVP